MPYAPTNTSLLVEAQQSMMVPRVRVTGGVENVVLNVLVFVTESFVGVIEVLEKVKEFDASQQIMYRVGFTGSVD